MLYWHLIEYSAIILSREFKGKESFRYFSARSYLCVAPLRRLRGNHRKSPASLPLVRHFKSLWKR